MGEYLKYFPNLNLNDEPTEEVIQIIIFHKGEFCKENIIEEYVNRKKNYGKSN